MLGGRIARRLAGLVAAGAFVIVLTGAVQAQEQDDLTKLLAEVGRLRGMGKSAEAIPLARQAVALANERYGGQHVKVASALSWLASLHQDQGRLGEAEPLFRRGLAIYEDALGTEHPEVGTALNNLALLHQAQGRFGEAEPLYQRSLAIREKSLGPDHAFVATTLNNLGMLYQAQGHYAKARPLFGRSLAIREKVLGPEHLDVGQSLNNLALLFHYEGRFDEAVPLFRRSLAILERALGPEHPSLAITLNNLALLHQAQGRYAQAEPLFKRGLAICENALGPEHPDVGLLGNNLAVLYQVEGRYPEAEPLVMRSLAIREKALGPDHPDVGLLLNNLAEIYGAQGRHDDAAPLYRRSLAIMERALGPDHPNIGQLLSNLGVLLYQSQGRYAEAEPLFKRSLVIREKALGPEHPDVGQSLNNLALLHHAQGRYAEAEPLLKRSLAIMERALGAEHPSIAVSLNNLAVLLHQAQRRQDEIEPLLRRSLAIYEKALEPEHPQVGTALNNLAVLIFQGQGRSAEAEPLLKRSLAITEKALGPEHHDLGELLHNLAWLAAGRSDWTAAAEYARRSTHVIERRFERGLTSAAAASLSGDARRLSWQVSGLVKTTHRLTSEWPQLTRKLAAEAFEAAQWAQASDATASLAQMAARSAKGSPQLALLVRERQDLVTEWQLKDKQLIAAQSTEPANRNADAEKALAAGLVGIDARLAEIGRRLAQDFPDYAALATPAPVSITEVQAQLSPDEALVLFLDTDDRFKPSPEETFIWVVTRTDVRWVRSALGTAALTREVVALRCGLDAAAWDGDGAERCTTALAIPTVKEPPTPLPFGHARAHKLYQGLFGEVQDLIKSKHLLIVPSGPLTQLPFQVLVIKQPTSSDDRVVAWLARDHAITVLPAVSSLRALRRVARPSAARRPMIGVGNPVLDGPDSRSAGRAKLARATQRCPETLGRWRVTASDHRANVTRVDMRGGLADVAHLKALAPLPETASELCSVAHDVNADVARDIRLGSQATEREVKRLSASGELAKYRMVHFATHGALAGELDGAHEPGLILTPPATATEEDDGYLSASEIAALKLDADWVVLSACNTAAGGATNAEALSGLGRAFIYAGARSLLVSHWAVYSEATVKLITGAVGAMARDPKVGRAEAMRRSMLALIDKGSKEEAHPSFWAPFVVVGEGAAGR
jgi:CHAT domain-containing protein/tetratricopeptide (TPR) repeat protein